MKIDVSKIIKVDGAFLDIDFNEMLEGVETISEDFIFDRPVSFKGLMVNSSGVLKLKGVMSIGYTARCGRCLKEIPLRMEVDIAEEFKEKAEDDGEGYYYEGNSVILDKALKDNIILNLPVRVVCSRDCKGICPSCGINLNEKNCSCREESIDIRMEALKRFFE